nr:MAG TPA_asm: hypothetical protein [Caudoviricetes sp.]DAT27328.1 MAG TPA: hypothetical protein [Caudoviricetes sp.]
MTGINILTAYTSNKKDQTDKRLMPKMTRKVYFLTQRKRSKHSLRKISCLKTLKRLISTKILLALILAV